MNRHDLPRDAPPPVLIEYRDLVRCSARMDEVFEQQGWEEAAGEGRREVLFVHHGRLGCYRSARSADPRHLGCAGMPFPFGEFVIVLETAILEDGRDYRIESELQVFFFALQSERRRDVWSGRIALSGASDGSLAEILASAGELDAVALGQRLRGCYDCRADATCWQVVLSTTVLDAAMER